MTVSEELPAPGRRERTPRPPQKGWFPQLLLRLHFYAGLFVGPFIFVAALSGVAYAAAPSIDNAVYAHIITTDSRGTDKSLAQQVAAAEDYIARRYPRDELLGLKPATKAGATTQVMFSEKGLLDGQVRLVWVDPVTAKAQGDLPVYSTALPIATWIDVFHRTLFLGDLGRTYSELAASWLGIIALAGLGLWVARIRKSRVKRDLVIPNTRARGYRRTFSWHGATGAWILVGALFLSATGITWSLSAGANISALRAAFDWTTPSLTTATRGSDQPSDDGTAQRNGRDLDLVDAMLVTARSVNVHDAEVEIDLPTVKGSAWTVKEIRRTYPTAVNAVAIDADGMKVVSRSDWDQYPLAAKLTRWGIDAHMGLLWGLANQILLFVSGIGIATLVVTGFVMWWRRRPTAGPGKMGKPPGHGALAQAPKWGVAAVLAASLLVGWFLPEMGLTLIAFVLVDALLGPRRERAAAAERVRRASPPRTDSNAIG